MRKRRVELEQAVIACAREWRGLDEVTTHIASLEEALDYADAFYARFGDAVDALNEFEAAELTGAGARWVNGSPETSRGAAGLAVPVQGSARHQIIGALAHVARMSEPGYTDAQMEHLLRRSHQTVSSARNWLVEAGWVIDSGKRRMTPSHRAAVVWKLSDAGWHKLKEG
jgi:hypothetical protein